MKNEIVLRFCIWDYNDITHQEITNTLGIEPYKIYVKGQKKNPKNPEGSALIKENGWLMESALDHFASFEDQMNAMLDIIESKIDLFRPFCEKYYCEFSCAIFIRYDNEESTPSVHLNARYNRLIKELNIEFDIDLYCLPNSEG
jgi:Domain of unknown function (DUF4279)